MLLLTPLLSLTSLFFCFQVLTKDSVTVSVDAVVYYRVSNATVSVANVENAHHSTRLLAQTTLRNILGTKNLHEILCDRESISVAMQVNIQISDWTLLNQTKANLGHMSQSVILSRLESHSINGDPITRNRKMTHPSQRQKAYCP